MSYLDFAAQPEPAGYESFLVRKLQEGAEHGFEPTFLPDRLFDFQAAMVDYAVRAGRMGVGAELKASYYLQAARNLADAVAGRVAEVNQPDLLDAETA